jgi:hypothetical protein
MLDWSLSRVSSWYFQLDLIRSWIVYIFNSIRVELSIFSTRLHSTQVEIESTRLNSSRTWTWHQDAKNRNIEQYFRLFFYNKLHYLCALSLHIIFASLHSHLRICVFRIVHYLCALSLHIIFASLYFAFAHLHICAFAHLRICIFRIVQYLCALSLREKQEKILSIYLYLITCWVESSFQIELLNSASQLDSSSQVQHFNSTRLE